MNIANPMIGQTISHYKILEKLGSGGMGVVYKAKDTKLHRTVALKFLHTDLTRVEEAKFRFIKEAQAASALDHNNICNIHEIDETDENQIFICMAYYGGLSLRDKIENNSLSRREILDIAIQIARGLNRAHEAGMIHRDIKPANIMITDEGVVKIVDFGLAKLGGQSTLTQVGATPGTVAYMSPERLEGEKVDVRTDIWSYGILLYEMITGQLPFRGDSDQALIYSIVTGSLDRTALRQANAPEVLQKIITKSLEKNPAHRFKTFKEILKIFAQEITDFPRLSGQPVARISTVRLIRLIKKYKIVALMISLILVAVILIRIFLFSGVPLTEDDFIIIADFENFTNQEVFDNSLTQGLQISLKQSDFLNILPGYKINQAMRRMQLPDNQKLDKNTVLAIAERENIPLAITGSIDRFGAMYILTGNIINVASREIIKQQQISVQQIEDILAGMDKLVRLIRKDLGESTQLINKTSQPLAKVTTASLEALQLYTLGIEFAKLGKYAEAIEVEEKAVAIDSTFAMAIHSLSYNYKKVGDHRQAIYYHNKILPLIDRVTEKEKNSILTIYYGPEFERDYKKAFYYAKKQIQEYPDDGAALAILAHLAMFAGDYPTALEFNKKALAVDSFYKGTCNNNTGFTYALMEKPEEALRYFRESKKIRPDYMDIDFYIAQTYWIKGELDSTESIFQSLIPGADNAHRIRIHSYMTSLYYYRGMIEKAENHTLLGIDLCQIENKQAEEAYFLYLLSEIYRQKTQITEEQSFVAKAIELSQSPYWEISLSAMAFAKKGNLDQAAKLLEKLQQFDEPDPIFQKRRADVANYIQAFESVHEVKPDKALLHLQQINKHYSGDPLYWLALKEIGAIKLMMGDSTGLRVYRDILNHKGEIIMGSLGGVRRSGFWSNRLIPEVSAEIGKYYLERGDSLKALSYLRQASKTWQKADANYLMAQEVFHLLGEFQ
jgi:serine/threonine protein kinase/Flp pilus assembly protein TadD